MARFRLAAALALIFAPGSVVGQASQALDGATLGAYWKVTPLCEGQQDSVKVSTEEADRRDPRRSPAEAAGAQSPPDSVYLHTDPAAEALLARTYAPILRFGEDEGYFPTVPFLSAVDGLVNDSTSPTLRDLWSPAETAPLMVLRGRPVTVPSFDEATASRSPEATGPFRWLVPDLGYSRSASPVTAEYADSEHVYWWQLDNSYHSRFADTGVTTVESETLENLVQGDEWAPSLSQGPATDNREYGRRRSVVFYRTCQLTLGQTGDVWRFLRSDSQAWKRYGGTKSTEEDLDLVYRSPSDTTVDRIFAVRNLRQSVRFGVVQYFFYYLRDRGLKGHPEDIEMAFVFVPREPASLADEFRIVVGNGHATRTPNNVLVLVSRQPEARRRLGVLVELGGHSSAPDLNNDGQFTPGVDVNWQIVDAWGTRDIQAIGGVGFQGDYRLDMTFSHPIALSPDSNTSLGSYSYRLMPVRALRRLYTLLGRAERPDSVGGQAGADSVRAYVDDTLKSYFQTPCADSSGRQDPLQCWKFTGFRGMKYDEIRATIKRMTLWNHDEVWRRLSRQRALDGVRARYTLQPVEDEASWLIPADKHLIWNHDFYKKPVEIFKGHVFRPTARGISSGGDVLRLMTWGTRWDVDDGLEPFVGFVIPALYLPVYLPGYLHLDVGALGRYQDRLSPFIGKSPSLSLTWVHSYSRMFTWYQRMVAWTPRRAEVTGRPESGDWTTSVGVSWLASITRKSSAWDPWNAVRISAGLHTDLGSWNHFLDDVGLELSVVVRQ